MSEDEKPTEIVNVGEQLFNALYDNSAALADVQRIAEQDQKLFPDIEAAIDNYLEGNLEPSYTDLLTLGKSFDISQQDMQKIIDDYDFARIGINGFVRD